MGTKSVNVPWYIHLSVSGWLSVAVLGSRKRIT